MSDTYAARIIAFAADMEPLDQGGAVKRVVLSPSAFTRLMHERFGGEPTGVDVTLYAERMELKGNGFAVEVTKSLRGGGDTRIQE